MYSKYENFQCKNFEPHLPMFLQIQICTQTLGIREASGGGGGRASYMCGFMCPGGGGWLAGGGEGSCPLSCCTVPLCSTWPCPPVKPCKPTFSQSSWGLFGGNHGLLSDKMTIFLTAFEQAEAAAWTWIVIGVWHRWSQFSPPGSSCEVYTWLQIPTQVLVPMYQYYQIFRFWWSSYLHNKSSQFSVISTCDCIFIVTLEPLSDTSSRICRLRFIPKRRYIIKRLCTQLYVQES